MPATDRAVIEEPPTPVSTYQTTEEREQLLHRQEAQRLAAQAVDALNHRQDGTFDRNCTRFNSNIAIRRPSGQNGLARQQQRHLEELVAEIKQNEFLQETNALLR